MRIVKCYGSCNEKHPQEEMMKISGANYCKSCYDFKLKETKDREALYNLIKQTFNLNFPSGIMLRQIKEYHDDRGYTYKNIRFTIDYIVNIKRMKLQTKFGIALVPHFYDEMISYHKNLKARRESTVVGNMEPVKITIKPFIFESNQKERKMVDMNELSKRCSEEETTIFDESISSIIHSVANAKCSYCGFEYNSSSFCCPSCQQQEYTLLEEENDL